MLEIYQKALELYELAAQLPPTDLASRTIVARAHFRIGFTNAIMSRSSPQAMGTGSSYLQQADMNYRKAVAQFEELLKEAPGDPEVRCHFADALGDWGLGWFLTITQPPAGGEPYQRRALALRRELVLDPGTEVDVAATELVKMIQLGRGLAASLQSRGKTQEADSLRSDLGTVCRLLAGQTGDPNVRRSLARPLSMYGSELLVEDQRAEAVEVIGLAHILDPDDPRSLNNLAWALVCDSATPPFDPSRALDTIRRATTLDPEKSELWNTLGVAAFRLGDWKTASESLEKSMSLNKGGEATDWFFLAMTRWHQDRKAEARSLFDKAVASPQPQNHEFRRFQAEAEKLLGLGGSKPPG
jgi:Flp pilus assembly protein TadD